jgi:hypothetical protein
MEIIPTPWSVVSRSIAVSYCPPNSYTGWLNCENVRVVRGALGPSSRCLITHYISLSASLNGIVRSTLPG